MWGTSLSTGIHNYNGYDELKIKVNYTEYLGFMVDLSR